jgi:hypothetical protein
VFYYAVNSRLSPERTNAHALETAADAHQEDLDLGVAHAACRSANYSCGCKRSIVDAKVPYCVA